MSFTVNFLYFPPQNDHLPPQNRVTHVAKRVLADPDDNLVNLWVYNGMLRLHLQRKIHVIGKLPAEIKLCHQLSIQITGQSIQFRNGDDPVGKPLHCFTPLKLFVPKPEQPNSPPGPNYRLILTVAAIALLLAVILQTTRRSSIIFS